MMARSDLIEKSLICLEWGMAAFIPGFGVVAAGIVLMRFLRVAKETNDRWNPARPQLYIGMLLAVAGLLLHGLVGFAVYLRVIRSFNE